MNELMDCRKFVKVNCDWLCNVDGMNIYDCAVVRLQLEHETPKNNILALIEDTSICCVNFTRPESQNDPIVNISCDSKHLISRIYMCSEAKIIELFGTTGEYVSTHHAYSSENFKDLPMNFHSLYINSTECSLKLEQLNNSDFVWIYGMLIYLTEAKEHSNASVGPINMENVQHLLNPESLTTNASKLLSTLNQRKSKLSCNDFLNTFLKNLDNSKVLDSSSNENECTSYSFKPFEKKVEDKLNAMSLQLNSLENNIELLNEKFDTLISAIREKKI